jgi:branched-subunit amino acid aminotransferase/4-amino-4-deoxychorismate lyase
MSLAFHDGKFVDSKAIVISPLDYGFARGVALYDFTRVYGGVPFHMDTHLDRLIQGAEYAGIKCPYSIKEMSDAIRQIIEQNAYAESYVKLYLTAGECGGNDGYGFGGAKNFTPHFFAFEEETISVHPDAPKGFALVERGLNVKTVSFSRDVEVTKTINYFPGFRAAQAMAAADCDEIMFTHRDGYLTEVPTGNFFCVIDGVLCTPARGMLYGVTRRVLMGLALRHGLTVKERDITLDDLRGATEAFTASSSVEMMPIRRVDDVLFTDTRYAPVYAKLRKALTEYIAEYRQQYVGL